MIGIICAIKERGLRKGQRRFYGFIEGLDGVKRYFQSDAVVGDTDALYEGAIVEFKPGAYKDGDKTLRAAEVELVGCVVRETV